MKLKWPDVVQQFKDAGYEGEPDNFGAVSHWLKTNGHDTENVSIGGGESVALKDLFEDRPGKPFDATKANERAEFNAAVDAKLEAKLDELQALGVGSTRGKAANPHRHDVKVGRNRLEDDPKGGFKSSGHFLKDVANFGSEKGCSPELKTWAEVTKGTLSTYGNEATGADGGFAVPAGMSDTIMVKVTGEDSILSRTDQIPMQRLSMSFPVDQTEPWLNTAASGIRTFWEGEAGTYTQSKPVLEMRDLRLRKLTCLVPVTEELLDDATAMGSYVSRKAGEKLDFRVGEAIFRGTGAGQPLGFLNSNGLISVAKESNQGADTLVGVNVLKMWSRCYAAYRRNAVWFVQQDVEPELHRLAISGRTNTGGHTTNWGTHVYIPPGGLSDSPYGTLMGRPVIVTQHCETLGDKGDICLCAMDQYLTGVRSGGIESSSSIHLWFDQDAVAFKFRMRMDGQPWHDATIASRDGTNTLGAFVTLDAR